MAATKVISVSTTSLPSGGVVNVMSDGTVSVQQGGNTMRHTHKDLATMGSALQAYLSKIKTKKKG